MLPTTLETTAMEYCIRIKSEKERHFLEIVRALQALGVIEAYAPAPSELQMPEEAIELLSAHDFARQYRDLVD
jgi:hypothetical protein